jgi:hypothetical protein
MHSATGDYQQFSVAQHVYRDIDALHRLCRFSFEPIPD